MSKSRAIRAGRPARKAAKSSKRSKATDSTRSDSARFVPEVLDHTVIAIPLLKWFEDPAPRYAIVVDLNLNYRGGLHGAAQGSGRAIDRIIAARPRTRKTVGLTRSTVDKDMSTRACNMRSPSRCRGDQGLAKQDTGVPPEDRAIYHIWPDFP